MSRIRVTYDFGTNEWDVKSYKLKETVFDSTREMLWTDVEIAFRKHGSQHIEFNGLRYGYEFKYKDEVLKSDSWPPEGITIHGTDQEVMQHVRYDDFLAGEFYKLYFWVIEDEEKREFTYTLKVPGYTVK
jgi:hypothetical protein